MVSSAKKSSRSTAARLAPARRCAVRSRGPSPRRGRASPGHAATVVQHLAALFRCRVEDHALAEDRLHERVRGGLVELFVRGAEEQLVRRFAGEHHHRLAGQRKLADLAALVAAALHQPDRPPAQLQQVAEQRPRAGQFRRRCAGHTAAPPRGWNPTRVSMNAAVPTTTGAQGATSAQRYVRPIIAITPYVEYLPGSTNASLAEMWRSAGRAYPPITSIAQ